MSGLELSIAVGNYDRVRPLIDGTVRIDGVEAVVMTLEPEEIFFRAFRHAAFDICELSLSSYALQLARGACAYIGVPVYPSRAFRHTAICIRTDRGIRRPEDLRGRRLGTPEYQLTANVWARGLLADEHGIGPGDIVWVRGGLEQAGRREKITLDLPPEVRIEEAPVDATLSRMLADGAIDGIVAPRAPSCFGRGDAPVGWLYADPAAAAADWFRRTGIFPIMHLLGIRRSLAERHPWLPAAVCKAFVRAKAIALEQLADTSATKVTLPFVEEQLRAARALMGEDFWSYGVAPNVATLETFLRYHHAQGLSARRLDVAELFHPSTLEAHLV